MRKESFTLEAINADTGEKLFKIAAPEIPKISDNIILKDRLYKTTRVITKSSHHIIYLVRDVSGEGD